MSLPSVRRSVAVMPWDSRMVWKRRMACGDAVCRPLSVTLFRGIMLTCAPMPASFLASSSACSGESLTPSIMVYSKEMRRPVFAK